MDSERLRVIPAGTRWSRALVLLLLGLGGSLWPQDAEAQVLTKVGSFLAKTSGNATQSITGVGFQPKAVIFFWTNQTAAGFADHTAIGYGFSTGNLSNRAVGFSSRHSIPNGVYLSTNPARMQRADACVFFTNPDGGLDGRAAITSMDPTGGFTLDWATKSAAARIVHYMALGGPDITDAAVGTVTPTANAVPTTPELQAFSGILTFRPDFMMFLSIDSIAQGSLVAGGKVSLGYAGYWRANGITQGGVTAVSPVTDTAVNYINTTSSQTTDAAIVEKDFTLGINSSTFVGAVQSFDPTGFTINKIVSYDATPVYYLALRGGRYKVDVLRTTNSTPSYSRPDTEAVPLSKSYTVGFGFTPRGLLFASDNLRNSYGHEDARISFSAADSAFNQRATFFNDKIDLNGLRSATYDASFVRQGTSGSEFTAGKVAFLAQPGACAPKWPPPPPTVQCSDPARVITDADVTSYDPNGFTLNWTTNDLTNMNGFAGSDEANAQVLYVAFGDADRVRTAVGSFTAPAATGTQTITVGFSPAAVIFFWTAQTSTGFASNASAGYGFSTGANNTTSDRAVVFVADHNVALATHDPARWQWTNRCIAIPTSETATSVDAAARVTAKTADGFTLTWYAAATGSPWIIHYMALGGSDITNATAGTFTPSTGVGDYLVTGVGFQPDFLMFLGVDATAAQVGVRVPTHPKLILGYAANGSTITQGTHAVAARPITAEDATYGAQSHYDALVTTQEGTPAIPFVAAVTAFGSDGFTITKSVSDASYTPKAIHYLALRGGRYKVGWVLRPEQEGASTQSVSDVGFIPRGLLFSAWGEVQSDGVEPPPGDTIRDPKRDDNARVNFSAVDSASNARATYFESVLDVGGDQDPSWVKQGTWGNATTSSKSTYLTQAGDCPVANSWNKYLDPAGAMCSEPASVITDADLASLDATGFTLNWTTNDFARAFNIRYPVPPYPQLRGDGYMAEVFYVAFGMPTPTEVTLSSFTARGEDSAVSLEWETASELHNLGFHLYRATSEAGPYERITSALIPGLGSSPVGARYSYADRGLTNGIRYYYQLEDVETTGRTERHGPVSAVPVAGATTGDPGDDPDPGTDPVGGDSSPAESTRVPYGDPSAVSLQVLRRDSTGADLELLTGGFYATPEADGSMRLEIPGFELQGEPGTPAIPVERTSLEAVAGRQVRITSVVPSDVQSFPWSRPALAEAPELLVGRDGTVEAGHRRVRPAWVARRPYPAEAARVVTTAFQGETKKALLELAPLRWNSSTAQLLLARRLRVRVAFDGVEPAEIPLGGSRGRSLPRQGARGSRAAQGLVAHLLARDQGLYAVAFEDVFRYHRRAVPASRLRLSRLGQDVAFHVEPDPSRFSPGSVLYFASEGGSLSAHANEAVYELAVGTAGTAMPILASPPAGPVLAEAVAHRSWETNQYYISGLLEAPDLWLWDSIISRRPTKRFPFTLSGLAASSHPAVLSVWLQGGSDLAGSPDHHVRLYVNGSFVAEASWDGKTARCLEAALYPGLLHDGENSLDIENVGDTPAAVSLVYLDRFSLEHPRVLAAEAGRFEAVFGSPGSATLAGLGAGSLVLDTTEGGTRWVVGAAAGPAGLSFGTEAGHRYLAVSPEAVLRPGIRWPSMARGDLRGADNQADYLLLAPRELLPAAAPLLQLREEQGLRARAVPLEEVYDAFGYGEKSAEAIRDFIAHAYHRWTPPSPRYVLLLGDATYDPKDHMKTGVKDQLPALMFKSTWLWTASDPAYASVNGEDSLPDLAVGRWPASSLEQAERLVAKLVAFERNGFDPFAPAVLVADDPDGGGDFEADADAIAAGPLAGHATERIYLGRLGIAPTRSAILAAFDRGASLMSYVGHGAPAIWASEILLHSDDVARLSPQARQPIVFTMNCLNGYFVAPTFDSLAEAFLKADDKGAIAALSPSGLSLDAPAHVYHEALVRQVASGRHARLGDAILAAQNDYADTGVFPELLRVYTLFGDPAMEIR